MRKYNCTEILNKKGEKNPNSFSQKYRIIFS